MIGLVWLTEICNSVSMLMLFRGPPHSKFGLSGLNGVNICNQIYSATKGPLNRPLRKKSAVLHFQSLHSAVEFVRRLF